MLKKICFLALIFLLPVLVKANSPDSLFVKANAAYSAGHFKEARELYESILSAGFESTELYLNLGNACFRLKEYGWARLFYEKSKHLDPFNPDSFANLELVRSYSPDKITILPQISVKMAFLNGLAFIKTWPFIVFLIVISAITLFIVFRWIENGVLGWKKYVYVTLLVFTLSLQILTGIWVYLEATTLMGVVVVNTAEARSEPVDSGSTLFTLHQGTLLFIENEYKDWIFARLENGNTGWIPVKLIGRVN